MIHVCVHVQQGRAWVGKREQRLAAVPKIELVCGIARSVLWALTALTVVGHRDLLRVHRLDPLTCPISLEFFLGLTDCPVGTNIDLSTFHVPGLCWMLER